MLTSVHGISGRVGLALIAASTAIVLVATSAALDRGLLTLQLSAGLLATAYAAQVLPPKVSVPISFAAVICFAAVLAAAPFAPPIEIGAALALVPAAWLIGFVAQRGLGTATRRALILSRSDALTGALNRLGFLEELQYELGNAADRSRPVALVLIDLNGFKLVNDRYGHGAGDELLAWVGRRVPEVLPGHAAFGRFGGDEFAALLPGLNEGAAEAAASVIHAALAERVGASIGVAFSSDALTDGDALMLAADAALYAAKSDTWRRVHTRPAAQTTAPPQVGRPPLPWSELRAARRRSQGDGNIYRLERVLFLGGFATIALAGSVFIAITWVQSASEGFFVDLIKYGGLPWVAANLALGLLARLDGYSPERPWSLASVGSATLVGGGVGAAALSTGSGVASPIIGALLLKLLFDAFLLRRQAAWKLSAIIWFFWLVTLALGPPQVLWLAGLQAALMVGATELGAAGHKAFDAAATQQLEIAMSDPLTGLLNRRGFITRARGHLDASSIGKVAVLMLDLDGFKLVNDTYGHDAGDRLLQAIAQILEDTCESALAIGRIGGDEFAVLTAIAAPADAQQAQHQLDRRLQSVSAGSVGAAIHEGRHDTVEGLLRAADEAAYAVKRSRRSSCDQPQTKPPAHPSGLPDT